MDIQLDKPSQKVELWDKLNFMIYTTKKAKPNIDGLVKPLNLHHTVIPAQAGIH